ncbi:hypothetical protein CYLTODRAFT_231592 [Cylindrobasidium torrendii FP15055 ss-10]|uniref:Uncharacterized protein n=1 Tax=Cylindrobasidium torrendii FP15055 ss-10 TaxID=1314674 RepID=A0A0D7ATX1_9AGAR|nr:hypothetical protein CYLTODRAFT_231592 [Cylindrobasidium torrendii FP15055 ss-10]
MHLSANFPSDVQRHQISHQRLTFTVHESGTLRVDGEQGATNNPVRLVEGPESDIIEVRLPKNARRTGCGNAWFWMTTASVDLAEPPKPTYAHNHLPETGDLYFHYVRGRWQAWLRTEMGNWGVLPPGNIGPSGHAVAHPTRSDLFLIFDFDPESIPLYVHKEVGEAS